MITTDSMFSGFNLFPLMMTGAFSRNVRKLFSRLKLVPNKPSLYLTCFYKQIHLWCPEPLQVLLSYQN